MIESQLIWTAVGRYTFILNASTNQRVGEPFQLSAAVLRLGVQERYRGQIAFVSSDPTARLPQPYRFSPDDDLYESHQ